LGVLFGGRSQTVAAYQGLNQITAPIVAAALGGDAWQSGGGIWVIVKRTSDGRVLTLSPEVIIPLEVPIWNLKWRNQRGVKILRDPDP
jgi:hypothetical protein